MPNISASAIDLINNKLQQAMTITLLVQGDKSSDSPLNDQHIESALMNVFDLIECSKEILNDEFESARRANNGNEKRGKI